MDSGQRSTNGLSPEEQTMLENTERNSVETVTGAEPRSDGELPAWSWNVSDIHGPTIDRDSVSRGNRQFTSIELRILCPSPAHGNTVNTSRETFISPLTIGLTHPTYRPKHQPCSTGEVPKCEELTTNEHPKMPIDERIPGLGKRHSQLFS